MELFDVLAEKIAELLEPYYAPGLEFPNPRPKGEQCSSGVEMWLAGLKEATADTWQNRNCI